MYNDNKLWTYESIDNMVGTYVGVNWKQNNTLRK